MKLWLDAQLSPRLCGWLNKNFALEVYAVRDLGLLDADDKDIFFAARQAKAVVMTKDFDFVNLLDQFGTPPQVIWVTCGNTSNNYLKRIFIKVMPNILALLATGERLVEITDQSVSED